MRARALLAEPTIPLYHRIKTLLLLASIVGMSSLPLALDCFFCLQRVIDEIDEASYCLGRAEVQLLVARNYKKEYDNPDAEEVLVELKGMIMELRGILEKGEDAQNADDTEDS